jgi:hypothetical protein
MFMICSPPAEERFDEHDPEHSVRTCSPVSWRWKVVPGSGTIRTIPLQGDSTFLNGFLNWLAKESAPAIPGDRGTTSPRNDGRLSGHASGDGGNVSASVRIGVQARVFSPPPRQLPPRPAPPTSGDIVWYGKSGFFGHRTVNIYLGWYPLGEGGRWYSLPESDGKLTGSIPWPNFRLSWSADNEPVTSPRLVTAQPGNRPVRITFTFNRSGDHVIRFHWEQAP